MLLCCCSTCYFSLHACNLDWMQAWRAVAERPSLWQEVRCETHRNGTRRTELRRLLSLAAWAQRHAAHTRSLVVSARVPPDTQPAALKAVAQAALAAAGALRSLQLTTNRGHWPFWLSRLHHLRDLHLCSKEGGLSLTGDLTPLSRLAHLALDARHAVVLSDTVRCAACGWAGLGRGWAGRDGLQQAQQQQQVANLTDHRPVHRHSRKHLRCALRPSHSQAAAQHPHLHTGLHPRHAAAAAFPAQRPAGAVGAAGVDQ